MGAMVDSLAVHSRADGDVGVPGRGDGVGADGCGEVPGIWQHHKCFACESVGKKSSGNGAMVDSLAVHSRADGDVGVPGRGDGETDKGVLRGMVGPLWEVCGGRAEGDEGGDGDPVFDVGGGG